MKGIKKAANRKLYATVFGALIIAVVLLPALHRREPRYQGKSLSQWVRGLEYNNVNPTTEQRAALRAMGEPAITRLIEMLEHRDSLLKRKFVRYARNHPNIHNRFIAPRNIVPEHISHAQATTALGEPQPT